MYTTGQTGEEEVVMDKAMAERINAKHLAREAYIERESNKSLKTKHL
jgi:hypothetical protein